MKSLKQQLYDNCRDQLEAKIKSLTDAIHEIQLSANEETKSSAGDKYETGRAMAQLEVERHQLQLADVVKMKEILNRVPVEDDSQIIKPGSLIFTSRGNFYIAVNAGQFTVNGETFISISAASPIAQKLLGLAVHDTFTLNNQAFTVLKIQ